jgi:hypothetical protein
MQRVQAGAGNAGGRRGSSGGGGATWGKQGRASVRPGRRWARRGGHVARCSAARRRRGRCTWPTRAAAARRAENRGGRGKVDEGGLNCNFPETQGLHCNVQVTFKPELK